MMGIEFKTNEFSASSTDSYKTRLLSKYISEKKTNVPDSKIEEYE
jgi:hypothetical protein